MQKTGASVALYADAYLPASDLERSKDPTGQTAYFRLQSCSRLVSLSDLTCVSARTCGCWTREPRLCLGGLRQGELHRNGFVGIRPDAPVWLAQRMGSRRVAHGTAQ